MPHMLVSFTLDPLTLQVLCGECVAASLVHWVSPLCAFRHYAHVECHGVHRLTYVHQMHARLASARHLNRLSVTWCQLEDATDDLPAFVDSLHQSVRAYLDIADLRPEDVPLRDQAVAETLALLERARIVDDARRARAFRLAAPSARPSPMISLRPILRLRSSIRTVDVPIDSSLCYDDVAALSHSRADGAPPTLEDVPAAHPNRPALLDAALRLRDAQSVVREPLK